MPTKADAASAQIQRKSAVIDDIKAAPRDADAAVLTEYRGLSVTDIADLRAALRPAATDYKIFKNTLARRAATDAGLDDLVDSLTGPVAIAFVRKDGGDAVTAAKALRDFAKTNPNLVAQGRDARRRVLTTADIEALADVPPRDQLLARLAGGFQAPMVKAAGLFQAFTRNFAYGLKALHRPTDRGGEAAHESAEAAAARRTARAATRRQRTDGGSRRERSRPTLPSAEDAAAPTAEPESRTQEIEQWQP